MRKFIIYLMLRADCFIIYVELSRPRSWYDEKLMLFQLLSLHFTSYIALKTLLTNALEIFRSKPIFVGGVFIWFSDSIYNSNLPSEERLFEFCSADDGK